MEKTTVLLELKQILGSMIFGANRSLRIGEMKKCLSDVAQSVGGEALPFAKVSEKDIRSALAELTEDMEKIKCGFFLKEVAAGFRFQSDVACGKWLKNLLDKGRPDRLSSPALETLAIIAYRQPVAKPAIEGIRGVDVSQIIKNLMEMQLVRIVGRSELPGKPFLYGTTHSFLEHFGLRDLNELNDVEPMLAIRKEVEKKPEKNVPEVSVGEDQPVLDLPAENEDQAISEEESDVPDSD